MLTHDSLVANLKAIMADIRPHSESVYVSWLPLYHDMGLIFMTLAGLFAGRPIYLMAPAEFLRHPDRWLRAISTYGGTITAAPNFAYRLCVERVNNAQLRELDLSRMECLLNGSEPVRVEDMEAFLERFAPAGLKKKAIHGGYGMAELGVYASSGPILTGHHPFDPAALENRGQVVPLAGRDPGARLIAPCGVVNPEHLDLRIVDMQTGCECAPQHVGEIWLAGPSVGKGYWNNAEATEATFGNRLPGRSKTYLRTGDKGFVYDGRIYICGRLKEIIILRGRNIFPNDVCALIESNVAEMRGRRAAAFGIPGDSGEELVVVSAARVSEVSWRKVARQITAVLGAEMGIIPFDIVFVPNRALSRTTSGKVQHGALRQAYLEGRLEYEFAFTGPISHVATIAVSDAADADDDDAAAGAPDWMVQRIQALCSFICNRETLEDDANLFELGLDSLRAVQLLAALESDLMGGACSITIPEIVELKTPRNIAAALARAVQQNHASRSGFKEVLL
jgi:acyl-CoA synthetase (AMP-forming)/AMP-acid ligase II/acyl carrier protein